MEYEIFPENAAQLPTLVRLGTSTWTYPGWQGLVYRKSYNSDKKFKSVSLQEYADFPWFKTVGIDHSFYTPATKQQLTNYASQVPKDFVWLCKVWEHLTTPHFPNHARYGQFKNCPNPAFLNAQIFIDKVLPAYDNPDIKNKTGPFIFQFPYIPLAV